jgi:predicted metal-binding membrane protein
MSGGAAILRVSRRDRAVVAGALAGIVVLAWIYILRGAGMDTAMNMAMGDVMMPMPWTFATFRVMLVMWIVMMTAMMLPSAAPMILLFATINRRTREPAPRTQPAFSPSPIGPSGPHSASRARAHNGDWNMQGCCLRPWQPPAPPWRGLCSCSPACTNSHR